jgi:hypothetical protein
MSESGFLELPDYPIKIILPSFIPANPDSDNGLTFKYTGESIK